MRSWVGVFGVRIVRVLLVLRVVCFVNMFWSSTNLCICVKHIEST